MKGGYFGPKERAQPPRIWQNLRRRHRRPGAAANIGFRNGEKVEVTKLVKNIGLPDYPAMPARTLPLPMPKKRE